MVRSGRLAFCGLALACGRVSFDHRDAAQGGGDGDGAVDAAPLGPFPAPSQLATLGSPQYDDDVTLTGDMLEIYFASTRPGGLDANGDIWYATRATTVDPWSAPALVPNVNSNVEDQSCGISADGLTLYFTSRRTATLTGSNIFASTRASRATTNWSTPTLVTELSSNLDDFEPQPDPSALRLVLYRHLGGVDRAIFESTRTTTTAPWGIAVQLTALDAPESERSPCLGDNGLTIYFSSDRESGTTDVHDIFVATRPNVTSPFTTPQQLANINDMTADDDDPWISPDGHVLFFESSRSGDAELWTAER